MKPLVFFKDVFKELKGSVILTSAIAFQVYLATRAAHCILFLHDRAAYNNNNTGKKATSYALALHSNLLPRPHLIPIKVPGKSQNVSSVDYSFSCQILAAAWPTLTLLMILWS